MPVVTFTYMDTDTYLDPSHQEMRDNLFVGLMQTGWNEDGTKRVQVEEFTLCSELERTKVKGYLPYDYSQIYNGDMPLHSLGEQDSSF